MSGGVQIAEMGRPPSTQTVHGNELPVGVVAMMVEQSAAALPPRARVAAKSMAPNTTRFMGVPPRRIQPSLDWNRTALNCGRII
jgi:hypothetical protein